MRGENHGYEKKKGAYGRMEASPPGDGGDFILL